MIGGGYLDVAARTRARGSVASETCDVVLKPQGTSTRVALDGGLVSHFDQVTSSHWPARDYICLLG
jgi:hypothetical protein